MVYFTVVAVNQTFIAVELSLLSVHTEELTGMSCVFYFKFQLVRRLDRVRMRLFRLNLSKSFQQEGLDLRSYINSDYFNVKIL